MDSLPSCLRKNHQQTQFDKQWTYLRITKFSFGTLCSCFATFDHHCTKAIGRHNTDYKVTLVYNEFLPSMISNHQCGPMAFFKMGDEVVRSLVVVSSFRIMYATPSLHNKYVNRLELSTDSLGKSHYGWKYRSSISPRVMRKTSLWIW